MLDLNHPSCLELTLACAQIGAANAVVNFRLAPPEIVYVINDAKARLLFVGPEFAGAADKARAHLPSVERVIRIGGADDEYEAWLAAHEPDARVHPTAPDDCFVQLYTSGTTGFPKGAMLTHHGMLAHSRNVSAGQDFDPESRVQVAMPLFHVGGTSYSLMAISLGARIFMMRMPDPGRRAGDARVRADHAHLLRARADGDDEPGARRRRARLFGAEGALVRRLADAAAGDARLAEAVSGRDAAGLRHDRAVGAVSVLPPQDHVDPAVAHRLVSAGKAITGVEIEIRDTATGEPVAVGERGEVWVRSDQLMGGYWGKPDATAATITADGWLRSGDGGYLDADGYLYITDRIKDMIISGGENIYPAEIERVLAEHPAVQDVAVIGVPDERWGEVPKAVVVAAPGATIDAQLLAWCGERLASFKCPKTVDVVGELPRNPTGKILKKDLRKPYWEGRERQIV